jgi:hypothetical protein
MLNRIVDASPSLQRFLDARLNGASEKELKALQAADEASRETTAPRWAVRRVGSDGNVIYLPDRTGAKRC